MTSNKFSLLLKKKAVYQLRRNKELQCPTAPLMLVLIKRKLTVVVELHEKLIRIYIEEVLHLI